MVHGLANCYKKLKPQQAIAVSVTLEEKVTANAGEIP